MYVFVLGGKYHRTDWMIRRAKRDTVVPLSRPITGMSGKSITELAVPAGTEVFIGIQGCNTSEFFWGEDAQEWKPERWLSPLPESITEAGMPGVAGTLCVHPSDSLQYLSRHFKLTQSAQDDFLGWEARLHVSRDRWLWT